MTQQELKHILSSRFDFEKWKDLLGMMFLKIDYLSKPIQIEAALVKSGGQVGVIRLDDGRSLGLFKFEVADNIKIARNRKGLRDIAIKYVDQDITHGALVFYYSEDQADYRLTFVSKQTSLNEDGEFVTKATAPKRYTFLLGENEPCTTAANRLLELINKKKNGSVCLADVTEAFSVERLNKDFFKGYKDQYGKFLNYIGEQSKAHRDYVKKLLGRLVFLQFLQKKGWMGVPASNTNWEGGDKNYLNNLIENYKGNNRLLSDVLEVLFFNTLNEKRDNDLADKILGKNIKIPYLNGGLFDKDSLDKLDIDFPYDYFKELMDFFAMYNFTIDENDPDDAEVGVDPEMLGHIFENLLEDNKDKGAFYTPKEIVQYMSEESIAQYLKTHAEEALHPAIEELIKQKKVNEALQNKVTASAVYKLLCDVKVCDPAIGSGAFPMGVLNVLYHSRLLLYGFTKPTQEFSPANVKREIIQNNIYGVDIEQGAVDIARLRFWLTLVVDETQPEPLPNLDFKIMQGNSLLEEFGGIDISSLQNQVMQTTVYEPQRDLFGNVEDNQMKMTFTQKETVDNLQANLEKYFNINDHTQKQAVKEEISNSVKNHISYNIELRRDQCLCLIQEANEAISDEESQIEDIKARFPEDKMPVGEIRKHEKKISDLKKVIDRNNKEVLHYDSVSCELETIDLTSNEFFFLWHTWFKDVFDNGGFDVVIGNPPYIQLQSNEGLLAKMYEKCGYESYVKTGDLYCLFYEQSNRLLVKKGHLCFITSNKWMRAGYGEKLRDYFSKNVNPKLLVDFAGVKVFDNATVDTNILLFERDKNEGKTLSCTATKLTKDGLSNLSDFVRQQSYVSKFESSNCWVILSPIEQTIKTKIENAGIPLKDWDINIYRGVLTGFNDAFIISGEKRQEILNNCTSDDERKRTDELIRPILRGRDIKRYEYNFANLYLINAHNGIKENGKVRVPRIDICEYPAVKKHLDEYWEKIQLRADKGDTPYNLRNCAYMEDFNKPSIAWIELTDEAKFAYCENMIVLNTVFFLTGEKLFDILGMLNSTLILFYFRNCLGTTSGVGTNRWLKYTIEQLPLFYNAPKELEELVKELLKCKDNMYDSAQIDKKIDYLIFTLFGLSTEEIDYVNAYKTKL